MDAWIAPVLGLVGVLAGAMISAIVGERHSRKIMERIVAMLESGSQHGDKRKVIEKREKHLYDDLRACSRAEYGLLYLEEVCMALSQTPCAVMIEIDDNLATLKVDTSDTCMGALARVRAAVWNANRAVAEDTAA